MTTIAGGGRHRDVSFVCLEIYSQYVCTRTSIVVTHASHAAVSSWKRKLIPETDYKGITRSGDAVTSVLRLLLLFDRVIIIIIESDGKRTRHERPLLSNFLLPSPEDENLSNGRGFRTLRVPWWLRKAVGFARPGLRPSKETRTENKTPYINGRSLIICI